MTNLTLKAMTWKLNYSSFKMVLVLLLTSHAFYARAQEEGTEKFSMGLKFGLNSSVLQNDASLYFKPGRAWLLGMAFRKKLTLIEKLPADYTIELLYEHKSSFLTSTFIDQNGTFIREIDLYSSFDYFSLPLSLSIYLFKDRILFIDLGTYFSYLHTFYLSESGLARFMPWEGDVPDRIPLSPEDFKGMDMGLILGLGLNIKLSSRSRMILTYRYSHGLVNVNKDVDFRDSAFSLRSNSITLGFLRNFGP